jgi:hypothetical protein
VSFTEHMLAEREHTQEANLMADEQQDDPLVALVSEIAKLIEQRNVPTDKDARRIRDLRTKMLHKAAVEGTENCR